MPDPSYGLIVEGRYDGPVFVELVSKLIPAAEILPARVCDGITNLKKQFPGWLRDLERAKQGDPVDKAFVIRDSGGRNPAALEQELAKRIEGHTFAFPRGIEFCVVVRAMETWLLADEEAINAVASSRSGRSVRRVQEELEHIVDPKDRLRRLLKQAKLDYTPEVCREIARRARIDRLQYRCPSFLSFEKKVIGC